MQSTQFSTTVLLFLKSAKPWVTAAAHTLLCSNVVLTKKWIFKGRGLVRGHTVDFIIRGGSLYPCTNDNSSQCVCVCVCVSLCVCVCGGGGCSNKTPSSGLPFEKCFFLFFIVIVIILWHASCHKTPNYIMKK